MSLVTKVGFAVSGASILVVNKLCVFETNLPSFVCAVQLGATAAFVALLAVASVIEIDPIKIKTALPYVPWVLTFVATMYTSMMALHTTNIDTVVTFRCLSPIFISLFESSCMSMELPSLQSWIALLTMLVSSGTYAYFDEALKFQGMGAYSWVVAYVLCDVTSNLLGRQLTIRSVKLPTWAHMLYANLLSLPPMVITGFAAGEHTALLTVSWNTKRVSLVTASCVLAIGISYFSWRARVELSASAYSVISVGTKIGSVALNLVIWDQHASRYGLAALLVCVAASASYRSPPPRKTSDGTEGRHEASLDWLLPTKRDALVGVLISTLVLATMTGKSQSPSWQRKHLGLPAGTNRSSLESSPAESWSVPIVTEFQRRKRLETVARSVRFPLASDTLDAAEIEAGVNVMLSGKLTMAARVSKFERELEAYLNVPCAVMVNSGSSANLIAVAGALELSGMKRIGGGVLGLRRGDEVLVPALAWSTTLAPLVQLGLRPVLVDVVAKTLNMDVAAAAEKITGKTRAIMLVHAMGNSPHMEQLMRLATKHRLVVIEDTCESLGSRHGGHLLGTQGHFGAYSFYYSHHITSGEGGAVVSSIHDNGTVCQTLRSLRAHGWTREFSDERKREIEAAHPDIDPRFLFVHWGFNVRPMEIQAAMASIQLTRLENLNQNRRANFRTMKAALASHRHIFSLPVASPNVDPAWFGLILVLNAPYAHQRAALFEHLGQHGVETRPVISGNFARQPVCNPTIDTWTAACGINAASSFPNTDVIHSRGLYIGLPSASTLTPAQTEELRTAITSFPFSERHVTLVTGANGVVGTALRSIVSAVVPTAAQRSNLAFVFVNRTHADLRNASAVNQLLFDVRPTKIIHLAAKIAPMSTMQRAPTEFFEDNVKINQNVLRGAEKLLQSGLLGGHLQTLDVVSCLSTAMLPDNIGIDMPVNETTVMKLIAADEVKGMQGYPAAKWAQLKLSMAVAKKSPRLRAVTVLPSNIFGPGAKCDASGPLLNAIIVKAVAAKAHKSPLYLAGTGQPLRHMLFSEDLAKVLLWALDYYHDSSSPLIVARNEVRVSDLARMAASAVGFSGKITFDHKSPDGPLRRAVSTAKLDAQLMGYPLIWTPLNAAIEATASSCIMGNRQLSERAEEPNKGGAY